MNYTYNNASPPTNITHNRLKIKRYQSHIKTVDNIKVSTTYDIYNVFLKTVLQINTYDFPGELKILIFFKNRNIFITSYNKKTYK